MTLLAAKLLLAPAFVVALAFAARRCEATAGGVLAGLPVVTAPILLIIVKAAVRRESDLEP